jgi:hypothetical protein
MLEGGRTTEERPEEPPPGNRAVGRYAAGAAGGLRAGILAVLPKLGCLCEFGLKADLVSANLVQFTWCFSKERFFCFPLSDQFISLTSV